MGNLTDFIERLPESLPPFAVKFVLVTPKIAEELLKYNTHNRTIHLHDLTRYKNSLLKKEWQDGISVLWFGSNNVLIDGQHRLLAIVKTGVSAMFQINYMTSDIVSRVIDTGRSRTPSDIFRLEDIPNSYYVQSSINCYFGLKFDDISGSLKEKVSTLNMIDEYYSSEDFWQEMARFSSRLVSKPKGVKKPLIKASHIGGIAAYLIKERKSSKNKVFDFFTQILSEDTCENETLNKFRKWLSSTETKPTKAELFNLIATYWNAFLLNKTAKEPRRIAFDKRNWTKFI